jgi:hypothetical protein
VASTPSLVLRSVKERDHRLRPLLASLIRKPDLESRSGNLDLRLNRVAALGDGAERLGVHAKHCEQCLAAGVSQENAKGESSKYSTGNA